MHPVTHIMLVGALGVRAGLVLLDPLGDFGCFGHSISLINNRRKILLFQQTQVSYIQDTDTTDTSCPTDTSSSESMTGKTCCLS